MGGSRDAVAAKGGRDLVEVQITACFMLKFVRQAVLLWQGGWAEAGRLARSRCSDKDTEFLPGGPGQGVHAGVPVPVYLGLCRIEFSQPRYGIRVRETMRVVS